MLDRACESYDSVSALALAGLVLGLAAIDAVLLVVCLPDVAADIGAVHLDFAVKRDLPDPPSPNGGGNGGGGRSGGGRHPFIEGLLQTLPEPETNWAVEGRAKWLQAAANIFDLIYKGDGDITVKALKAD